MSACEIDVECRPDEADRCQQTLVGLSSDLSEPVCHIVLWNPRVECPDMVNEEN